MDWSELLLHFAVMFAMISVSLSVIMCIGFRKEILAAWREYQAEKPLLKKQLELFKNGTETTNKRRIPGWSIFQRRT